MKDDTKKISGILLAGGKSTRMGEDKAFMKYNGQYLYEYSLSILRHFSEDILISSSNTHFNNLNYKRIDDEIPNLGPLGGIYSCLKKIKNNSAIVLPCDLPLITRKIIEILISESTNYQITTALNHLYLPEPLIGIYSTSLIPVMEKMIESKNYKLQELLKNSRSNFVEMRGVTPETFININNLKDFNSLSLNK